MPKFLDTLGNSDIAIAICDRCKMKRAHSVMRSDPNFAGLQVCDQGCADEKDPYRLPARPTERITIRFPRPDLLRALINAKIGFEIMDTQAACRTYNILVGEGRQAMAALLLDPK